jgi:hypothetical protein
VLEKLKIEDIEKLRAAGGIKLPMVDIIGANPLSLWRFRTISGKATEDKPPMENDWVFQILEPERALVQIVRLENETYDLGVYQGTRVVRPAQITVGSFIDLLSEDRSERMGGTSIIREIWQLT